MIWDTKDKKHLFLIGDVTADLYTINEALHDLISGHAIEGKIRAELMELLFSILTEYMQHLAEDMEGANR